MMLYHLQRSQGTNEMKGQTSIMNYALDECGRTYEWPILRFSTCLYVKGQIKKTAKKPLL
jgi:hypothetical protein